MIFDHPILSYANGLWVLLALCLLLIVADVIGTKAAIKNGGHEAMPWIAWLQRKFPSAWGYILFAIEAAVLVPLAYTAIFPWSGVIMGTILVTHGFGIINNFSIAKWGF